MTAQWLAQDTKYVRAGKDRDTIHLRRCRYAAVSMPWVWAEGRSPQLIGAAARTNGLRLCKVCNPTGGAS